MGPLLVIILIWATLRENVSSGIFDQVRFKPVCSATEASYNLETLEKASIHILSKQWTTNVLIRLRGCAGWSVPLLFAYDIRHVCAWSGPFNNVSRIFLEAVEWYLVNLGRKCRSYPVFETRPRFAVSSFETGGALDRTGYSFGFKTSTFTTAPRSLINYNCSVYPFR